MSPRIREFVPCLLLVVGSIPLFPASPAMAATWYAATWGSTNSGHGLTPTDPAALFRAVMQAGAGDVIEVGAGTYVDQGILTIASEFTIRPSSGFGSVIIDCTFGGTPVYPCISFENGVGSGATVKDLVFQKYSTAIQVNGASPTITGNEFTNSTYSVDTAIEVKATLTTSPIRIAQNRFEHNNVGIWWDSSSGGVIEDNDFLESAMDITILSGAPTITQNVFWRGRTGVNLVAASAQNVEDNEFREKSEWGIHLSSGSHVITKNRFYSNAVGVEIDTSTVATPPQTASPSLEGNSHYGDRVGIRLVSTSTNTVEASVRKNRYFLVTEAAIQMRHFGGTQASQIDGNWIHDCADGVVVEGGTPVVTNNYIERTTRGVLINPGNHIPNATVSFNTIRDGVNGIVISGETTADESGVFNNIVAYHSGYGFRINALGSRTSLASNDSFGNGAGNYVGTYTDWGRNATFDPRLNSLWVLDTTSPAIGYADTSFSFVDHDILEKSRSSTGPNRPEIGCYELSEGEENFEEGGAKPEAGQL